MLPNSALVFLSFFPKWKERTRYGCSTPHIRVMYMRGGNSFRNFKLNFKIFDLLSFHFGKTWTLTPLKLNRLETTPVFPKEEGRNP